MKKLMIPILSFFSISTINAGVSLNTVVDTADGLKNISTLKVGDKVICLDTNLSMEEKAIAKIEEIEVASVIEITTEDDTVICVSPDQRVFVPYKWVSVDQLALGDYLLKRDKTFLRIKCIRFIDQPSKLRFIAVEDHQNFLVSKNGILIHNGVGGATAGFWIGRFIGQTVGYGIVAVVSLPALAAGPAAYGVVVAGLSGTCAPLIESASQVTALAGGIIGGTATGPV